MQVRALCLGLGVHYGCNTKVPKQGDYMSIHSDQAVTILAWKIVAGKDMTKR